jgi:hypothetical protein
MTRVALILCGQMRTFDHPKVLEYLNQFIDKFNCDVFLSTWDNRGVSVWSEYSLKNQIDIQTLEKNKIIKYEDINIIKNIKKYSIENYNIFINEKCTPDMRDALNQNPDQIYNSKSTSIPSLYKLYSSFKLLEEYKNKNNIEYDIVIKSRPDFLQVHNNIEQYFDKVKDTLFHINTGVSYYPERVYEMFLLSSYDNMKIVCDSWLNYQELVNTNYSTHLPIMDACRLVYAQCMINNIHLDTFDKVLGDVLRVENYSNYQEFENLFI